MTELEFWRYAGYAGAFAFGFIVGAGWVIWNEARREGEELKREFREICGHQDSWHSDRHPDFPWTCNDCGINHDGHGSGQHGKR